MTLLLKDPGATLDYAVDWGAEYLTDDYLAESRWAIHPEEDAGATITGSRHDDKVAVAQIAGGVPGHIYRISNHVRTASGGEDSRSIMLRVETR